MKKTDSLAEINLTIKEIHAQGPLSVYLISGTEDYFVLKAREAIAKSISDRNRGTGIEYLDGENLDMNDLICKLNSPSLFEPFQIVIVRNFPFFKSKPSAVDEKKFLGWLSATATGKGRLPATLICTTDKLDKRLGLVKAVEKSGRLLVFDTPQTYERGDFQKDPYIVTAHQFLSENKKSIQPSAWMLLRQRVANNLWAVMNALEILVCYSPAEREILPEHVDTLIAPGDDLPVFSVTEALGERNVKELRIHLETLLMAGTPPVMMNKLLTSRIRGLLIMRELLESLRLTKIRPDLKYWNFQKEIFPLIQDRLQVDPGLAELLGSSHPYAIYQHCIQASKFTRSDLTRALIELSGVDLALKSSNKSPLVMFEMALFPLCYS